MMVLIGGLLMRYYGYYTYMFKLWFTGQRKVVVLELSIDAHTYVSRLLTAYVLLNLVAYSC